MVLDMISAFFIIMLCYVVNKLNDELEIKRLIKIGKEMEKETIIDVEYKVITDLQLLL